MSGLNGEIGTDDGGMYFGETGRFLMRENVNGSLSYRTAKTNTFVSAYQGIYDMDAIGRCVSATTGSSTRKTPWDSS